MSESSRFDRRSFAGFLLIAALVPLGWRVVLRQWGPSADAMPPSYLPALEATRVRTPFDQPGFDAFRKFAPHFVVIGDSMGYRIDANRLTQLAGEQVVSLVDSATGSAYWYLAFKNIVGGSGLKPKWTFVFFRDTVLTDPMFRIEGTYREPMDRVAHDREDELNAVIARQTTGAWYRVIRGVDALYGADRARDWLPPALTRSLAQGMAGAAGRDARLEEVNDAFGLSQFRALPDADIAAAEDRDADFAARVDGSLLPAFFRVSREQGLRLCFVRVMRRPMAWGEVPAQSRAMRLYIDALGAYLRGHGAVFWNDYDDPTLAQLPYEIGDHLTEDGNAAYTERFLARIKTLPQ